MYEAEIQAYFAQKEDALVQAISRLVCIRSVKGDAAPGQPFGPGPAAALCEALKLARELGFAAADYDGYVGTVDLNDKPTELHILAHLDVVGEGAGWTVTAPYEPKLVDGLLYGRGTDDDKGPCVAALFAMLAVRELGIPLTKNVRLILGTDEESGSADLAYYYAREPYAPCTFSPDAQFPVVNIEKGRYAPAFSADWPEAQATPRVSALRGGFRLNVVPPEAEAVVVGIGPLELAPLLDAAAQQTGARITATREGDALCLRAIGTGGHAAEPNRANNALTALLHLLAELPLADCGSTRAVRALRGLFPHGDNAGHALGVACPDAQSGDLTVALTMLELDETGCRGQFDSRTALSSSEGNCRRMAEAAFAAHGFSCTGAMHPPHHTPADSPFVQALLRAYEAHTGRAGACLAMGGATYVHGIPGGVAFGAGFPEFDSGLHGPDERVRVADLLAACKVFAQVIADLCA